MADHYRCLSLTRKLHERIIVGDGLIEIEVVEIRDRKVRLTIRAPVEMPVDRQEVHLANKAREKTP